MMYLDNIPDMKEVAKLSSNKWVLYTHEVTTGAEEKALPSSLH